MAFRDWPTSDGYNMFFYPWLKAAGDKFIEHGHRLMGILVGLITIAVTISVWSLDRRRWVGWLAIAALFLVIAQGLLGGLRVRADAVLLARIHACTGPLFLATTAALAVVTSRLWHRQSNSLPITGHSLRVNATALTAILFLQIVVGAHVRHVSPYAAAGMLKVAIMFHLLLALFVVLYVAALLFRTASLRSGPLFRPALGLGLLVTCQVFLGMASWVVKYSWPAGVFANSPIVANWTNTAGSGLQSLIVTTHVAVGSLMLAVALQLSLRTWRLTVRPTVEHAAAQREIPLNHSLMGAVL